MAFNSADEVLSKAAEAIRISREQSDIGLAIEKVEEARALLGNAREMLFSERSIMRGHGTHCVDCWLGHH